MNEILVIFSLAATGCLVYLAMDLAMQFLARRSPRGGIALGPGQGASSRSHCKADPVLTLGATLACYFVLALMLVAQLPGMLTAERTWLAIQLMCVGGLIGEISRAGTGAPAPQIDPDDFEPEERVPGSLGLSVALMIALNLAVAMLISGQGLLQVVPPPASAADNPSTQLEQIVVVARRGSGESASLTFL